MQSNNMCDYCKKRDDRPFCYDDCDVAFSDKNKTVGELNCEFEGMEVKHIRHGKWDFRVKYEDYIICGVDYNCSNCGKDNNERTAYCPHCGARMDSRIDGDEE